MQYKTKTFLSEVNKRFSSVIGKHKPSLLNFYAAWDTIQSQFDKVSLCLVGKKNLLMKF
jgi:hypothetical protein